MKLRTLLIAAAGLTILAGTVRSTAVALVAALVVAAAAALVEAARTHRRIAEWWRPLVAALLAPLGLLGFLGYVAVVAHVHDNPAYAAYFAKYGNNFAVPALMLKYFPAWFVGVAFAAVAIGALVPAAIMSIAAANLYTRNIHREFINNNPTDRQEAQMAKWVSLIVKVGALVFILFVPTKYAIELQLLGGIWIIQTLPAVMLGVYTRWFNSWALLIGWAVGTLAGTAMAVAAELKPAFPLTLGGYSMPGYTAFYTLILNLLITVLLTLLFNAAGKAQPDETVPADYRP